MGRWVQVRPDGTHSKHAYWYASNIWGDPGGNAHAYVNDNSDDTYLYGIMSDSIDMSLHLGGYTMAGDERCAGARLIQRIRSMGAGPFNLDSWLVPVNLGDGGGRNFNWEIPNFETHYNDAYWAEFTQATINATRANFRMNGAPQTTPAISEVYAEFYIQNRPTISITSPSWNQRLFPTQPTISWNYDSKGDSVFGYRMRVFTAAVAEGGGFNPDSSASVWDTGDVGGAANSRQVGVALTHGQAYYAYVRIATNFLGGWWWSAWASVRFIINSPSVTSAVTVTPATPITTTNQPTIGWTYSDVDGDAQQHYYIRVFPESVYSAPGFTPDTDVGTAWSSGTVADSGARSRQTGPLSPNVNYKAWVYTTDTGSGTRWSVPASSSVFTIQTAPGIVNDPPAVPEVVAVSTDQDQQRLAVTFQGRDNMMTRNQASADTGILGMEADANIDTVTLTRDTTTTLQGGGAWKMTPLTLGVTTSMRTTRTSARGPFPVVPGRTYTALGSSRSIGTARQARLRIRWYNAAAAFLSITDGAQSANASGSWKAHSVTAIAPADAAWAEVVPEVITPSEAHFWENLSFAPGSSTTWTRGGLALELGALADSFDRADSAALLGIADVGGAWNMMSGTWGIQGNRAYLVTAADGTEGHAVLTSAYLADGYVEADFSLSAVQAVTGLLFRALDSNNLLMVEIAKVGATDHLRLYKRVAGTWTTLATATGVLTLGATHKVRVEFYGGQVYVFLDGTQRIAYLMLAGELNQFGAYGKYGIRVYRHATGGDNGASRIDNFRAGNLPTQRISLERSLDGGVTWELVRSAVSLQPIGQQAIVYDYEVPAGVLAQYRTITTASESTSAVTSAYSPAVAQSVALTIDTWWLKDAVDPSLNMTIKVAPPFDFTRKEVMSTFDPVGREESVFVSDGAKGIEGTLNVWVHDRTTYDKLEAILGNGRALLLQDPLGRSWWVKFGAQDWSLIRAQPQLVEASPIRHFHGLSLPFVQVGAPAVV